MTDETNDLLVSIDDDICGKVNRIVAATPVSDLHTHLFGPPFGDLLLWGIDEALTYHYLAAELLRATDIDYDTYWHMDKRAQADLIWRELFLNRSPISEACRGVLTILDKFGLDLTTRDLVAYRAYFENQRVEDHIDTVFRVAGLKTTVMTNDPFDPVERKVWLDGFERDPRFQAALRIDPLLNDWPGASRAIKEQGYNVDALLDSATTRSEVRRFLTDWIIRMKALYMAVSLPPTFRFPEDSARAYLIHECVLPVAREQGIPFAMMIGVKRNLNPPLKLAADGVGLSCVDTVAHLCAEYPENAFMVTMLARENQHELSVTARKFRNLCLFGCWWFLNNPSLIEEMTRMRFELLGMSVIPQHSDARVLDQVVYKWTHSREIIAKVLADKYCDLARTGWMVSENEIQRDAAALLGDNFWSFLARYRS